MTDITAGEAQRPAEAPFLDNPHAPEVFAETAAGFFVLHGNIHLTFTALRVDHSTSPGPVNRVVIGRLVLPVAGAQALAVGLYDFLSKHGLTPERPGTGH